MNSKLLFTINGKYTAERITGMQRYAHEIISELDKICEAGEFELVVPEIATNIPSLGKIKIVRYGKSTGIKWEQIALPRYLRKNGRIRCASLLSVVPYAMPHGLVVAHGVNYKVNPQYFKTIRDKLSRLWHIVNFQRYFNKTENIVTVSEFSRDEISRTYGIDRGRIAIAGNAWQHMERIKEELGIFEKYPILKRGAYYFSMSSVSPNKNFAWIAKVATINTQAEFAIAGGRSLQEYLKKENIAQPPNLHFLGYVTDGEAKALMAHCKAFLFPTFYEGFGIPPMEAMACGASAIVSDTPTMHEIYGNTVHYIDPYNANVDLDTILAEQVAPAENTLQKYTWKASAATLYAVMKEAVIDQ